MKMATFQRNAILSGNINSYCLVCERYFETDEQTFSHINGNDHENTLQGYPHLEKYGNNGIRKVKAGYFCEHCSQLMTTGAKVNLHVAEKQHYYNKGSMLLKQSGIAITAFDDVLITEAAWHSLRDDECAMCNAEFDSLTEHIVDRSHLLKLLTNKVQFGDDNSLYRKIDKNDYQCLTCNITLSLSEFEDHFKSSMHKDNYKVCQEEKTKHDLANPKVKPKKKTEVGYVKEKKDREIVNNVETIAGISVVTAEAIKKAPNTNIGKSDATKETKINKTNKTEPKKPEPTIKLESSDPETYAKDHQLVYDKKNHNAYCRTCQNKFPSTLHSMREHIYGREHISNIHKMIKTPQKKTASEKHKRPMELYFNSIAIFDNTLDNDVVLNETICVGQKSCHLLTKIDSKFGEYTCQLCMVNLTEDDIVDHTDTMQHERGMRQIMVLTNYKTELIREVRPDTFHCGFCNVIIVTLDATELHLKTAPHKANSADCYRRLQIHLPAIRGIREENKIKSTLMEMFANHMRAN